jgi:hypothetical protein
MAWLPDSFMVRFTVCRLYLLHAFDLERHPDFGNRACS